MAEPELGRIQKLDARGRPLAAVGLDRTSTLDGQHLAISRNSGTLIVTDPVRGRLLFYSLELEPLGFADGSPDSSGALRTPAGVAIGAGRIWVAEARRNRLIAFDISGDAR